MAVADDDRMVRLAMRQFIEAEPGMACVGDFANAEAALAFLQAHKVDVLVMDLQMPGLGGLHALPRIREADPDVQTVVLSGFSAKEYGAQAFAAGACTFLQKPVNPTQFAAEIRAAARRR